MAWASLSEAGPEAGFCRLGLCETVTLKPTDEPTNPFVWSDLGETLAASGDTAKAREAFAQSVRLGPNIPPILIRAVNFEVGNGELERAIPALRRILELTAVYDNLVFRYLSRSGMGVEEILERAIPDPGRGMTSEPARTGGAARAHASAPNDETRPQGEAARAWAGYLMAERRAEAENVFNWLQERGAVTQELRNQWVENLVQVRKQYQRAQEVWAAGQNEPGYPAVNRIFDGQFKRERAGARLDWNIATHPHVGVKTGDGLTLAFDGMENLAYSHLSQQTFLPAGQWQFSADVEANDLTTDQRPYFRISDTFDPRRVDVSTPMAPALMEISISVPEPGSWVTVSLLRGQSVKFDSKIRGTMHIRGVKLTR